MTVTFKNTDKCTDCLLDFIAGGVPGNELGESAGNYNAVFGHINASRPLSAMTLTQIYVMQGQMYAVNKTSTATGRYQGLRATIQGYQKRKKLPDTTLFTEALQDDFGLTLLEDCKYVSWWKGKITDDEFMHNLSVVWASLPDPDNDGKSNHDGDIAGNHASTSLDNFRGALAQARAYQQGGGTVPAATPSNAEAAVRAIQAVLVMTGDLPEASAIDGIWGPHSQQAFDAFKRRLSA
jgi:muramidase (phage lysozyme)